MVLNAISTSSEAQSESHMDDPRSAPPFFVFYPFALPLCVFYFFEPSSLNSRISFPVSLVL